jgi:hypothetical protein
MDNGNENLVPENGVECADGVIGQLQIVPKRHRSSYSLAAKLAIVVLVNENMTSRVQILDVGINKPFKTHMRNSWLPYVLGVVKDETMNSKIECKDMSKWIGDAWDDIRKDTIVRTVRKIGFIGTSCL